MKDLISVIVPVYNVEQYLEKSIESIIKQTYSNLEIILVDDGSPDNCGNICDELASKDKRIKVIHTENNGVSVARNYGFKNSKGNYIVFLDSDDILEPIMIKRLYDNIIKYNASISTCGYSIVEINGIEYQKYGTGKKYIFDRDKTLESYFSETSFGVGVWNKLFRRDIISNLKFSENLKINEDRLFLFEAILNSNKTIYDDVCLYKYIKRENSATTSKFSKKQFDVLKVNQLIHEKLIKNISIKNKKIIESCKASELIYLIRLYRLLSLSKEKKEYKKEKIELLEEIKKLVNEKNIKNLNLFEKIEIKLITKFNYVYYPAMKFLVKLKFLKGVKTKMQRKRNKNENSNINNTR